MPTATIQHSTSQHSTAIRHDATRREVIRCDARQCHAIIIIIIILYNNIILLYACIDARQGHAIDTQHNTMLRNARGVICERAIAYHSICEPAITYNVGTWRGTRWGHDGVGGVPVIWGRDG